MPTGRLGTANITTTADTTVYTVPASTFSVVTVNVVNRSSTTSVDIRIAVASSATPSLAEYIEYDADVVASGVLERTGIVMDSGKLLVVSTPTATPALSVVVMGIETSTA
jgi:small-conductance mechanosensitive channel